MNTSGWKVGHLQDQVTKKTPKTKSASFLFPRCQTGAADEWREQVFVSELLKKPGQRTKTFRGKKTSRTGTKTKTYQSVCELFKMLMQHWNKQEGVSMSVCV